MSIEPKNYSTKAIESISAYANRARYSPGAEAMVEFFDVVAMLLDKSVKFILPDNGKLVGGSAGITETKLGLMKLPFPIVALEYDAPDLNDNLLEGNYPSMKRIALAFDMDIPQNTWVIERLRHCLPGLDAYLGKNISGSIAITSIYHIDKNNSRDPSGQVEWGLGMGFVAIDPNESMVTPREIGMDSMLGEGPESIDKRGALVDAMPVFGAFMSHEDVLAAPDALLYDVNDELLTTVDFCAIMNCQNVAYESIPASEKLNKKRAASGKPPLYEYKILTLDPTDGHQHTQGSGQGTHASPRIHLRRGHIRRLQSGKVTWVNAAVVGNKHQGVIDKDYRVTSQRKP